MRNKDGVSVKYIRRKMATEGDMPRGLEILLTSKKLCGAVFFVFESYSAVWSLY
jgi:hypothetical protein